LSECEIFWRAKAGQATNGWGNFSDITGNLALWYPYNAYTELGWGSAELRQVAQPSSVLVYHTINMWTAANDWGAYFNGAPWATDITNVVQFSTTPYIGGMIAFPGNYWIGYMKSIAIFNRKLTTQERSDMNDYMDALGS